MVFFLCWSPHFTLPDCQRPLPYRRCLFRSNSAIPWFGYLRCFQVCYSTLPSPSGAPIFLPDSFSPELADPPPPTHFSSRCRFLFSGSSPKVTTPYCNEPGSCPPCLVSSPPFDTLTPKRRQPRCPPRHDGCCEEGVQHLPSPSPESCCEGKHATIRFFFERDGFGLICLFSQVCRRFVSFLHSIFSVFVSCLPNKRVLLTTHHPSPPLFPPVRSLPYLLAWTMSMPAACGP